MSTTTSQKALRADLSKALLRNAIAYAERGWHVFPLRPGDKRPAFPDHSAKRCQGRDPRCRAAGRHVSWEQRATTDVERIRRAWSRVPYNVGIACGPSDLVVVDLDTPKPGQSVPEAWRDIEGVYTGADVFTVVCDQAGRPFPDDTFTARTGRGGQHLFYRHPEHGPPLRNTQGDEGGLGWLIDTRAHGGYVVAAPSIVAGRAYTIVWDTPAMALPEWLAARLAPRPLPPRRPVAVSVDTGRHNAYVSAAIRHQLAHLHAAPNGGRNRALFVSALALGQLAAGGAITDLEVYAVLVPAAHTIGLAEGETTRTIASGLRAGARHPRHITPTAGRRAA